MEAIRNGFGRWTRTEGLLNEGALLVRARRGDRSAFDGLVARHEGPLKGFLRRRLPIDAVEDVLQETFLAAWSALPAFEPRVRFKTWLYRIALHKTADWLRRRPQELSLERFVIPLADGVAATERTLWVQELLQQLPEDQRLIIELYYYDDLTLAEVALVLDRNLSTVKYHFYQAHLRGAQLWRAAEEEGV